MKHLVRALLAALSLLSLLAIPAAAAPRVVASILPVQSLVAGVMQGIGKPHLLVEGASSPHDFTLSPSSARALQSADAVFWVGPNVESFLVKPLAALPRKAQVVALASHLRLLKGREGGNWESHHHDGEGEAVHDEHEQDMHVWLDPVNATVLVGTIVATLQQVDPANATAYAANGGALVRRLEALNKSLAAELAPVKDVPFVVFHDAYQYFQRRYGLNAIGSITVSPEHSPGARRLMDIRRKIQTLGARCVFTEPQFPPALARTVTEGTGARLAALDPLGATIPPGPDAYFSLMTRLAAALRTCLAAPA